LLEAGEKALAGLDSAAEVGELLAFRGEELAGFGQMDLQTTEICSGFSLLEKLLFDQLAQSGDFILKFGLVFCHLNNFPIDAIILNFILFELFILPFAR
jgi:hypothetical protein